MHTCTRMFYAVYVHAHVLHIHENPAHAQTVDTRPFFLSHVKRAVCLPVHEKGETGAEGSSYITDKCFV